MKPVLTQSVSDLIRAHVCDTYLKKAVRAGDRQFTVNVGTVHKALGLVNRVPQVCSALESKKLLDANGLRLVSRTGPASGRSTTVTLTYEIVSRSDTSAASSSPFLALRGIAKDMFAKLGGGEAFIKGERRSFSGKPQ
jgi:hypothetical protein